MLKFNRSSAFRAFLISTTSAAFMATTPVWAQGAAEADEADDGGITEIVVTAQRREESLQKVPLSVTAITGAELRNSDTRDITRLEQAVPGLRIARSGPSARPAIRGIYTETIGANSDPRIGFYVDEVYQSRPQQTIAAFVDLERVEVQKGPQGTLFGRNSFGGNIALTSAKPTDEYEGGFGLIYGNYNRIKAEGFVNIPIADGIGLRVAGAVDRHDPYLKSVVNSRASAGDLNYQFVRATLRIAPPSLDDRLEILLRGSYFNQDDRGQGSSNSQNLGAIVDTSLIRLPGQTLTFNGVTYPFPSGYNGGNYATGTLVPFSPVFRDNIPDIGGADIGLPIAGPYTLLFDYAAQNRVKAKNSSSTINFDITDNVRVRSITGYNDFFFSNRADGDGGPIPFSEFYAVNVAKTFTQELQLQSTNKDSPLQYTVGAYYMNDKINEASAVVYPRNDYSTVTAAANGFPVLYANGSTCSFAALPTGPLPFSGNCNISNFSQPDSASPTFARTKSYAGYGQLSYTIGEKLTLTAGARYTVDDKDYRSVAQGAGTAFVGSYVSAQNQAFLNANPAATQAQLPFAAGAANASLIRPGGANAGFANGVGYRASFPFNNDRAEFANFDCGGLTPGQFALNGTQAVVGTVPNYFVTRCGKRKFKYWTYRVAADYQISPTNMVYASFSTGVHSGGFGAAFVPSTIPQGTFSSFDAENITALELGTKNSFFDRRLQVNAAIFYNKTSDNQVQGLAPVVTGPNVIQNISTITNLGSTKAPGAELSIIAKPVDRLTLRAAVNYLHARNSVVPAPLGFNSGLCFASAGASGNVPGSPCAINTLANNRGFGFGFFPNASTNPRLFVPVLNAAGAIVDYQSLYDGKKQRVQNTPDWSANFGLAYDLPVGENATLTPELDVLWSGSYLLSPATPNFIQKSYAKVDARLTWRTDNGLSLQAFVNNLTNKATLGRITTATLSAQGTYADPRTYGVRVGYKF
jgi:iron complex outermembrane recepter protein